MTWAAATPLSHGWATMKSSWFTRLSQHPVATDSTPICEKVCALPVARPVIESEAAHADDADLGPASRVVADRPITHAHSSNKRLLKIPYGFGKRGSRA